MTLASCAHTASYVVETSVNFYYAELADYNRACRPFPPGAEAACRGWKVALLNLWDANNNAAQANLRGGALPSQLRQIDEARATEQKARKAVQHP